MFPYPGDTKATELVYKKFGQLNVYSFILGLDVELDHKYPSPFRNDGQHPSFNIYDDNGVFRWNDHGHLDNKLGLKQRDCIGLLMQLEGIPRIEAIKKIWKGQITFQKKDQGKKKTLPYLSVRTTWNDYEWEWWKFIDRSLLKKHKVFPTELLSYGGSQIKSSQSSPSFTYVYPNGSWKVYSPNLKEDKWKSHNMKNVIDGWEQLPCCGDVLFIVSSKKDGLVMESCFGHPFLAPPSENNFLPLLELSHVINSRFKNVIVSLDSDKTGRMITYHLSSLTGWQSVYLPNEYLGIKDQTDIAIKLGYLKLKTIYERIVENRNY